MNINSLNNLSSIKNSIPKTVNNSNVENIKSNQKAITMTNAMNPLSSRYTYAMGKDGKRYILQLTIDISSMNLLSTLA